MNPQRKFHFWKISLIGQDAYGIRIGDLIWDLGAFRPDPRDYLSPNRTYNSKVQMEPVHLYSGRKVSIPRKIWIHGLSFINMR